MSEPNIQGKKQASLWTGRVLGIFAFVIFVAAWIVGVTWEEADVAPFLKQALPEAGRFEHLKGNSYAAWGEGKEAKLLGYVTFGQANGYGGPIKVAAAVDLKGEVLGVAITEHKETPSYLRRVLGTDLMESLLGKSYADPFQLGEDVDSISGATYTTRALAEAVQQASRDIAKTNLNLTVPPRLSPKIQFGMPEATLIILYGMWFFAHRRRFKYRKALRWFSFLLALVVLGFVYNRPLTLAFIDKLLLGFWPAWQTHLYLYLLVGGMLLMILIEGKNPYCTWTCPFGAAQECLGAIGGAKLSVPSRYRPGLRLTQRTVAWFAVVLAVLFRNPGISSYEVFGTLFDLIGSSIQFALLVLVLILSLFIKRPWCNFLCPIRPVEDFLRGVRKWVKKRWLKLRPNPAG